MSVRRRRNNVLLALLALGVAVIAARVALPYMVRDYVNRRLAELDGYGGSVGDVDMGLWRGAYTVDQIEIVRTGSGRHTPFFKSDRVDFSVEWHSLLHGSLVSEAHFYQPQLNLVQARDERNSQLGTGEHWHERLEQLFPFHFNTVEVHQGVVTFLAPGIEARDALTAKDVNGVVTNLTNVVDKQKRNFAQFDFTGAVLGEAPFKLTGSLEPFSDPATFDLNLSLQRVDVTHVNPWLRKYLKADAERGQFELYLELASADGRYDGYAKPLIHDVRFFRLGEPEKNPLRRVWEGVVDLTAKAVENHPQEQVAARIPIRGTTRGREGNVLATIASVLSNAFVHAFSHSLDNTITLKDVS
jgi:uncharacterized protein DUF748